MIGLIDSATLALILRAASQGESRWFVKWFQAWHRRSGQGFLKVKGEVR